MPKIIIDMGLLDQLLIKFHRKLNVVVDMILQQEEKSKLLIRIYKKSQNLFHKFHKKMEKAPEGTINGHML